MELESPSETSSTRPNCDSSTHSVLAFEIRKGLVGLRNPHYFCYMNSALQGLISIMEFRDYFLHRRYQAVDNSHDKPLSHLLGSFPQAIFKLDEGVLTPKPLWQHVVRAFPLDSQHDLADFLSYVLEQLEQELMNERELPIVTSMFLGETSSALKCYNCNFESTTKEPFSMIILSLQNSIDDALSFFTCEEGIAAEFKCRGCKMVGDITKRMSFVKLPRVLCFQIKRFEQYPQLRKLEGFMKFKLKMSHQCFVSRFKLLAVIVHSGSISGGHYTAYTKRNHRWYLFNDDQVRRVELKEVTKQEAYCLLYT
jgi:ubiquitin C-terminal hydrolase